MTRIQDNRTARFIRIAWKHSTEDLERDLSKMWTDIHNGLKHLKVLIVCEIVIDNKKIMVLFAILPNKVCTVALALGLGLGLGLKGEEEEDVFIGCPKFSRDNPRFTSRPHASGTRWLQQQECTIPPDQDCPQ